MVHPGVSALGKKNSTTGLPRKSFRLTGWLSSLDTLMSGALSPISMKHHSFIFQFEHLYRNRYTQVFCTFLLALTFACLLAHGQSKKQKGPRALGVVAWSGNSETPDPATSVLDPVAIYVDGRFYDAALYQAQPEPLAVDSGVVYDVLQSGDSIGTFTLGGPREQEGAWYGIGRYEPKAAAVAQATKPASPSKSNAEPEDERPRLRRGTPPPPAPKEQTDVVLNNIDRDPQRPTLRRHTASEKKAAPTPEVPLTVPPTHMLAAISTESGPDYRPFRFHEKPGELDELRGSMEKLARAELAKETKAPAAATASRGRAARAQAGSPSIQFTNIKFGVYDVNSDNAPILVYSATTQVDGAKKYLTVAAWEEIDQSLRRVFVQVTDDRHLDIRPRLEIVDAVDARGTERGELLFRAFGDQGSRFILYHPGPDSLEVLFDSARGES